MPLPKWCKSFWNLSRIESGQVPFRFLPVPVSDTVLTPVERMQPLAARGNIELIVDLPPRLPRVYADAERIPPGDHQSRAQCLEVSPLPAGR